MAETAPSLQALNDAITQQAVATGQTREQVLAALNGQVAAPAAPVVRTVYVAQPAPPPPCEEPPAPRVYYYSYAPSPYYYADDRCYPYHHDYYRPVCEEHYYRPCYPPPCNDGIGFTFDFGGGHHHHH